MEASVAVVAAVVVVVVAAAVAAEAEQTGRVQPRCSEICSALAENNIMNIKYILSNASLLNI